MRGPGPKVQHRPRDGHGAIDLAGMNDADHVATQRDDMYISGRLRIEDGDVENVISPAISLEVTEGTTKQ